ncbi:MAG: DUF547 domain-containing protein [Candidatus Omnitrophica bacterium]|nr:DUF547 domain-containing protein [Candidatus Omnitrophota bacterium]
MAKRRLSIWVLCVMIGWGIARSGDAAENPRERYSALLSEHVKNGMVDYAQICADFRLDEYLRMLNAADPEEIETENGRLAFWINVYNAYTLKVICDHYPLSSINELHRGGLIVGSIFGTTVWDEKLVRVNGRKITLNHVEHKIIRPRFNDPRIHFALVCAAKGCPPLRSRAYTGERLDAQLNDQGARFLSNPEKNAFDAERKVARVSKIFAWFREDFGGTKAALLEYLARFLPEETAVSMRNEPRRWRIRYTPYDWSLNEQ